MLRILGKASSINVRKVLWTCAELDLRFEREDWGAGFQLTRTPQFLALNPNALVPVIDDDGVVLWESNTICRYLAGRHGDGSLLPPDPAARAGVEQWMDWQATELNNAWRYAFMALVRHSPAHGDPHQVAHSVDNWNRHMGILEARLEQTGAYASGAQFTLAGSPAAVRKTWAMAHQFREKSLFNLTRMVQRSKVSNALHPRSPWSSRVGTQGRPDMTRFQM